MKDLAKTDNLDGDQLTDFGDFLLSDAGAEIREGLDAVYAYLSGE